MWSEPLLADPQAGVTGFPMEAGPEVSRKRKKGEDEVTSLAPDASNQILTVRDEDAKMKLQATLQTNLTDDMSSVSSMRRKSGRQHETVNYYDDARAAMGLSPSASRQHSPEPEEEVAKKSPKRKRGRPPGRKRALAATGEGGAWESKIDAQTPTKIRLSRRAAPTSQSTPQRHHAPRQPNGNESHKKRSNSARTSPARGHSPVPNGKGAGADTKSVRDQGEATSDAEANGHVHDNNDYCSACGGHGRFLCCENCPRSFHFLCVDPPVDEDNIPDGAWFCKWCETQRHPPVPYQRSLFSDLLNQLERRNPRQFRLPSGIRTRFEGVAAAENGDYVDELHLPLKKPRDPEESLKLEDGSGNAILCVKCHNSALSGPIATCVRCEDPWHVDCLDPPQYSIPRRWVCPNHPENAARLPRRLRKPNVVDSYLKRGQKNNGYIEVMDESDAEETVKKIPFFGIRDTDRGVAAPVPKQRQRSYENADGVIYRIPARSIKLDFIDMVHERSKEPYHETPSSQLLLELDELATKPIEKRQAVRDLMYMKLQGPVTSAAASRHSIDALVSAALEGGEQQQLQAIQHLIKIKGRDKLLQFLTS